MTGFNIPIAAGFGLFALLIGAISRRYGLGVDDENASRFTLWIRNQGQFTRGVIDGILASVCGISGEIWVTERAIPAFESGGLALVGLGITIVIGLGLGFSMAKALAEREYRFVGTNQ